MKIFLDTANLEGIKKWAMTGLIDGVTTNPTHLSKEGRNPKEQILAICAVLPEGEISVEVTEQDPDAVYKQAKDIAALAGNIVVKIPCHHNYYQVIRRLAHEEIPLNITLVFTLVQGLMMCKLGVRYISPFVGRLDDIDCDGIELLPEMREMVDEYGFDTGILAASLRGVRNVHDAIIAGADAATISLPVFEKMIEHPLTDQGIKTFSDDWATLRQAQGGIRQFP
jgi:transaldolase